MVRCSTIKRVVVLCVAIQILFPLHIFAQSVGKITEVRGDVSLTRDKVVSKSKVEDAIQIKDLISTGEASRAKLLLGDDSLLSVGQKSKLEITRFMVERNKRTSILSLRTGTMYTKVSRKFEQDSTFEVHAPMAVAGVRGTEFLTVISENPGATFYALTEAISVFNPAFPAQIVTVTAGQFTTVALGAIPAIPAAFTPAMIQGIMGQLGVAMPATGAGAGAAGAQAAGGGATGGAGAAGTGAGIGAAGGVTAGTVAAGAVAAGAIATGIASTTSGTSSDTPTVHH
ncbi:MAG TPA: FecR domain-containing protein [Syntrophorhabdaceae bacterium]|nr:FecR domain-containing protein [Syntrophorhabdaceae bacterium]HQM83039.1 FecR domain-containing protein [Syntrophorhabdaceae bacterium]